eukprot:scaffold13812_cov63-Isochrysis_galbana.AAC.1
MGTAVTAVMVTAITAIMVTAVTAVGVVVVAEEGEGGADGEGMREGVVLVGGATNVVGRAPHLCLGERGWWREQ